MTAAAAAGFSSFDAALRLHDPWDTTLYNGVCFEGRKWHLLVDESSLDELPHTGRRSTPRYKAKAFQRFPILLRKVKGEVNLADLFTKHLLEQREDRLPLAAFWVRVCYGQVRVGAEASGWHGRRPR